MLGTTPTRTEKRAGRVLVVDDEPAVRELVARHYRRAGYQVVAAGSAEEVKTRGHVRREWDIVITDIHLPGLSGIELARMLSQRSGSVVLMTGDHDQDLAELALNGLKAGYLLKPFELFELDALVRVSGKNEAARRWWTRVFPKIRNAAGAPRGGPLSALLISVACLGAAWQLGHDAGDEALRAFDRKLTVNIGIAFQENWMKEPGELVTAADAALYAAKAAGRDCVRLSESIIGEPIPHSPPAQSGLRLVG